MRGAWWWACWLSFLRIYGFKTVYTLAGGANVVANCANPQQNRGITLPLLQSWTGVRSALEIRLVRRRNLFAIRTARS